MDQEVVSHLSMQVKFFTVTVCCRRSGGRPLFHPEFERYFSHWRLFSGYTSLFYLCRANLGTSAAQLIGWLDTTLSTESTFLSKRYENVFLLDTNRRFQEPGQLKQPVPVNALKCSGRYCQWQCPAVWLSCLIRKLWIFLEDCGAKLNQIVFDYNHY